MAWILNLSNMKDIKGYLKNIYLFQSFTEAELDSIAAISEPETFSAGDEIFDQGEAAEAMYLVEMGSLKVIAHGSEDDTDLTMIASGMHFGEIPFLDNQSRSATIEAIERCELIKIPYEKLKKALSENPEMASKFYHETAVFLASRLRQMTNDLSFSREKNLKHF